MEKYGKVRGLALAALIAAAVAGSFVALGTRSDGIINYYRDTLPATSFAVWFCGLLVATLSSPIVALTFWFGSKQTRHGWLLHILLMPVTYAIVRSAIAIMLLVANEPDSDGLTGWATDPAVMMMLLCPLMYFAALGFVRLCKRHTQVRRS